MKQENPNMNNVLKLFKLQNWRWFKPAEPTNIWKHLVIVSHLWYPLFKAEIGFLWRILTDIRIQKTVGSSHDGQWDRSEKCSNFSYMIIPTITNIRNHIVYLLYDFVLVTLSLNRLPKIEKRIMKATEIWMTPLLPTLVIPSKPALSLHHSTTQKESLKNWTAC